MKFHYSLIVIVLLFCSCGAFTAKDNFQSKVISKEKLREDFYLLKQIVQQAHSGAYLYNTPQQLDFVFDSMYNTIDAPLTIREFFNKVDFVIDRLHCIHSDTELPGEYYDSISNHAWFFPVPLIVVDRKIYVNSTAYTVPLGSEVVSINRQPAAQLIQQLGTYRHTDGYSNAIRNSAIDDYFALNYFLAYGPSAKFELQYYDTASHLLQTTSVTAEKLKDINNNMYNDTWYFFPSDAAYDFEMLDDQNTAVLTVRTFDFSTYASSTAFKHFLHNSFRMIYQNSIKNLVIDCRNNGGGQYSNTYPLLSYLLEAPIKEYDSSVRRFVKLPFREYIASADTARLQEEDTTWKFFSPLGNGCYCENSDQVSVWDPSDIGFRGNIYVITNSYVASAASNLVAILKERTNAYVVGDETAGNSVVHNAYTFNYELPHTHLQVRIPTRKYHQPVVASPQGRGVIPHKKITFTIRDVIDNTDRPLHFILDSLIRK